MPDRSLDVWMQGELVGRLDQDAGRLVFTYDPGWLGKPNALPLSASLPLRPEPFDDRAARPFFAGLLPEQERFRRAEHARKAHMARLALASARRRAAKARLSGRSDTKKAAASPAAQTEVRDGDSRPAA